MTQRLINRDGACYSIVNSKIIYLINYGYRGSFVRDFFYLHKREETWYEVVILRIKVHLTRNFLHNFYASLKNDEEWPEQFIHSSFPFSYIFVL